MGRKDWIVEEEVKEVVRELIYHGRHFASHRDEVVVRKCVERLKELFYKKEGEDV